MRLLLQRARVVLQRPVRQRIERDTLDLVRLDQLMARKFANLHECMITLPQARAHAPAAA